jgi:hypothetical protein
LRAFDQLDLVGIADTSRISARAQGGCHALANAQCPSGSEPDCSLVLDGRLPSATITRRRVPRRVPEAMSRR